MNKIEQSQKARAFLSGMGATGKVLQKTDDELFDMAAIVASVNGWVPKVQEVSGQVEETNENGETYMRDIYEMVDNPTGPVDHMQKRILKWFLEDLEAGKNKISQAQNRVEVLSITRE